MHNSLRPSRFSPTSSGSRRGGNWAGLLLIVLALVLYLATLDNGFLPRELEGGDLITHQYAQVQARPSNAPGYPLYTIAGWLWFHSLRGVLRILGEPQPNPIPLLSSYSTLWALLALWLLYQALRSITRSPDRPAGNWPIAWLVSATYAVTYFFWYYATTTEQYSSAVAQTLAIVYIYLLWREAVSAQESRRGFWQLVLLALLCGVALAHMLTVAFIVPPLVAVVLWQAPWLLRRGRTLIAVVLAAALPLLSYIYVYVRGAAHPEWWGSGRWDNAQQWFWSFVATAQGREELGWGFEPGRAFLGGGFPELIWQELSVPLLVVGVLGILLLDRKLTVLLYGTLSIYLIFCWAYRYGNWFQVILPAYPLLLMGVAAAADRWQRWFDARAADRMAKRIGGLAPHLLLVVAILWRLDASLPAADSRDRPEDTGLARAALLLDQPLPHQASLFAALDDALALQYLTQIWGIRSDLRVVSSREAARAIAKGEPLLATWDSTARLYGELATELDIALHGLGPDWILLHPAGAEQPTPDDGVIWVEQDIAPGVELAGYQVRTGPTGGPVSAATASSLDVLLTWQLGSDWPDGLAISVRPTVGGAFIAAPGDSGAIVQQDAPGPVHGLLSLGHSTAERVVVDGYRLDLSETALANVDGIAVIVYRRQGDGFENVAELHLPVALAQEN